MTPLFCGRRSAFALALIAALLAVGAQAQPASQLAAASSTKAGARRIFNPFVTVRPAYFKLTISDASQPFTQPIAGVTAPAGSTVTYVRVIYTSGVLSAAPSADAGGIDLTILDLARFPDPTTKIPVIVSYTVRGPTGGVGVGFLQITGPAGQPPAGPSPVTGFGPAELGVPLVVQSADVYASGWADPAGYAFGAIAVKPIAYKGAALPVALTNGNNWTAAEIAQARIATSTYTCLLPDLRLASGVPTAKTPACVTPGGGGLEYVTANSRFAIAKAPQVPVTVAAGTVYPAPLVGLKDGIASRAWATKLGFVVARSPALTTSSVTWTNGVSAAVSAAASNTATSLSLPVPTDNGDGTFTTTTTLTYSGGATLFGFLTTLSGAKGTLTATATLDDGAGGSKTVPLYLVAPLPLKDVKIYGGLALFGSGWTVASVDVTATFLSAAGRAALSELDSSVTARAYPKLTA